MAGRRIDDHSFFAGGKSKSSVFPEGVHTKNYECEYGAGNLANYEDNISSIDASQRKSVSKIKKYPMKSDYRQ